MNSPTPPDPRPAFAEAADVAKQVMTSIRPDQRGLPTPTEMNVAELLEHCVMVIRRVAAAGHGNDPSAWPMDAADVRDRGWNEAWTDGLDAAKRAWADDSVLARPTALPWTTTTGAEALATYTSEVIVHTWDLAQATAQSPSWTDSTIAVADAAMRAQLPMADRTPMWEAGKAMLPPGMAWESPFANAVDVAADAAPLDRLLAWTGRQP